MKSPTCQIALLAAAAVLAGAAVPRAQTPARPQQSQSLAVTTTAVLVDVVVRDRRGRPVTDLAADEFELFEDDVAQQISSFQLVSRGIGFSIVPARPEDRGRDSSTPPTPAPAAGVGTLALVFDRLSSEARAIATKAALGHAQEGRLPDDRIGVFSVDLSLRTVQGYTSDLMAIRHALQRVATMAATEPGGSAGRARELMERQERLDAQQQTGQQAAGSIGPGNTGSSGVVGTMMGAAVSQQLFDSMETRMLQTFDTLERDQAGYATTNALMSIVDSLRLMTGRKTIVFFSEGLAVPTAVQHHFRAVIDLANRANVAIYTMDAAGLRVRSELDEARLELQALGRERMRQIDAGEPDRIGSPMTKGLERGEDLLRFDPQSTLNELAQETGGFAIRSTNDLGEGFRRINDDMRFHYLLTYAPRNQEFDGKYRRITVKVKRPDVEARARRGYYAIRDVGPTPVLPHEAPAIALLDGAKIPNGFPLRAAALQFPEPKRTGLVPVLVALRTEALAFQIDAEKKRYTSEFVILVRLKDNSNAVVRKLSQHYELSGPIEQLALAKQGEVLFYKEPELEPGLYTMEAIAYDAIADRASARISTIEVRDRDDRSVRISSLMIVKRSEEVPQKERDPANPLYYGDLLLYPNLGEALRVGVDKDVSFYVAVYSEGRDASTLQARLELLQGGRPRGQAPLALGKPDAQGRILHVGRLPLDGFAPGNYELRFSVSDGSQTHTRSATFTVVP
jgi:VWFA-related protein